VFYRWTRDLHLYAGLFVSPFVLLFAVSVLFLNHSKVVPNAWTSVRTVTDLQIPDDTVELAGAAAVERARQLMSQLEVTGEVGSASVNRRTGRFVFPVFRPGLESRVTVDLADRSATVARRVTSLWETLAYLHKMPGPHNANIRGNWAGTRRWHWFADATVYLILLLTVSGIYLWYAIRAERRIGAALLGAGALTLCGLAYVIAR
jgi:hypothetical protein